MLTLSESKERVVRRACPCCAVPASCPVCSESAQRPGQGMRKDLDKAQTDSRLASLREEQNSQCRSAAVRTGYKIMPEWLEPKWLKWLWRALAKAL